MKVTIVVRSRFLGYHPGQIVILDDTPQIRRLISSGHAELVWSDQEDLDNGSDTVGSKQEGDRPTAGQRDGNGTEPQGGSSGGRGPEDSAEIGTWSEFPISIQRDSGEFDSQGVRSITNRTEID